MLKKDNFDKRYCEDAEKIGFLHANKYIDK